MYVNISCSWILSLQNDANGILAMEMNRKISFRQDFFLKALYIIVLYANLSTNFMNSRKYLFVMTIFLHFIYYNTMYYNYLFN